MIKIGVIGPNKSVCSDALYDFGEKLGKAISKKNRLFFNGGAGGFMEAVSKGVKSSSETFDSQTIGVLQGNKAEEANKYIDIAIPTGMGIARNIILVNSSDIIIAAGGGAGTLSELAFAWQKKKIVLCVTQFGGWSEELAGKNLDHRLKDLLIPVKTIEDIEDYIKQM
ncbi:TIGR00725 family protein [Lacinutrix chionoecetis]